MTSKVLSLGFHQNPLNSWKTFWERMPWWGQCVVLWLSMIIILSGIGLVSSNVFELGKDIQALDLNISPSSIPGIWARYDSGWYMTIAEEGYPARLDAVGFFPLFPTLMSGLSQVTNWNLALSGMVIAQLSYLGAILSFYKVAHIVGENHGYAMRSVFHMILFPTSLFLVSIYAEPLFLALALTGVYFVLRPQPNYVFSGLMIGLASMVRPVGWLLNIILLVEFVRRRNFRFSSIFSFGLGLALSASGILVYILYLYSITGTFTAITDAQAAGWKIHWELPWLNIGKAIQNVFNGDFLRNDWFGYVVNASDLLFSLFAVALAGLAVWWAYQRRFRWSLAAFLCCYLAFVLSFQKVWVPLNSLSREIVPLFPIYLLLGVLSSRSKRFQVISLVLSAGMLFLFTAWWASGRYVG